MEQFVNDPGTQLASALADGSPTTIQVVSSAGYPTSGNFRIRIDAELMLVTAISGTTWTVTRGIEGSGATGHIIGSQVNAVITSGAVQTKFSEASQIGTLSGLPSPSDVSPGTVYRCTDTPYQFVQASGSWQAFHGTRAVTVPPSTGWSWDNQGGSSVDTTNGGLSIHFDGNGNQWRGYYRTAPTAPYTLTTEFYSVPWSGSGSVADGFGIAFRAGGPFTVFYLLQQGANQGLLIESWNNTNSYAGGAGATGTGGFYYTVFKPTFLRIQDDNTNLNYSYSLDGSYWNLFYTMSRTAFMGSGPTELAIYARTTNAEGNQGVFMDWTIS